MEHFNRITDATRLKVGDLMIVPTEAGRKRKRLHLAVTSLGKLGLSVGDTCRAQNTTLAVRTMLEEDAGAPRAFCIFAVDTARMDQTMLKMLEFMGNSLDEDRAPRIERAWFMALPFPECSSAYKRLLLLTKLEEAVYNALSGKLPELMFFPAPDRYGHNRGPQPGQTLSEIFESPLSRIEYSIRSMHDHVPCRQSSSDGKPETMMSRAEIDRFMNSSSVFDYTKNFDLPRGFGRYDAQIIAPRKFFAEYARRGAMFYRPSAAFLHVVVAKNLIPVFEKFEGHCKEISEAADWYAQRLKKDLQDNAFRIKTARDLTASWSKEIAKASGIMEEFNALMK